MYEVHLLCTMYLVHILILIMYIIHFYTIHRRFIFLHYTLYRSLDSPTGELIRIWTNENRLVTFPDLMEVLRYGDDYLSITK